MSERQPYFTQIIGEPGCGKTTLLLNILNKKIRTGDRVIVIDPDGQEPTWFDFPRYEKLEDLPEDFKGMVVMEHYDELFDELLAKYKKGWKAMNLVLDDANFYSASRPPESLKKILMRKRQYELDVWSVAHGFSTVPSFFYTYITTWLLFASQDEGKNRKVDMQFYDKFIERLRFVKREAEKNKHFCIAMDKYANLIE